MMHQRLVGAFDDVFNQQQRIQRNKISTVKMYQHVGPFIDDREF